MRSARSAGVWVFAGLWCLVLATSALALPTFQDFDTPGTTYTETPATGYPTVTGGGPWANFMRIVAAGVGGNNNNIAFDRTEVGADFNRITATFDLSVTSGADGGCIAFLNTANYGTSGGVAAGPAWEEPALTNSFGVGFDNYQNGGEVNNNHISVYWAGTKLADITPAVAWKDVGFQPITVDLDFRPKGAFATVQMGATVVDRRYIGGLAPYENRVLFGARTGGVSSNFDVDNINVAYAPGAIATPPSSVSFPDFSDVSQFELRGSATQSGNRIRLTPSSTNQAGAAFLSDPMYFMPDYTFSAFFSFAISNPSSDGADGLAFVLQNDPRGPWALGGAGGAMGLNGTGAIDPYFAIVVKDYQNNNVDPRKLQVWTRDSGVFQTLMSVDFAAGDNLEDGNPRYIWIDYTGWDDTLRVFYSATAEKPVTEMLQMTFDLPAFFNYDRMPFVGLVGATGGQYATHEILSLMVSSVPEPASLAVLGLGVAALLRRRRARCV